MFSAAFRKPSVILKNSYRKPLQTFFEFSTFISGLWKIYRIIPRVTVLLFPITGSFLNAALNILKRVPKPSLENTGRFLMHFLWGHVKEYKNLVSREENSDAAFSKISRISKWFHRSKQNLQSNFLCVQSCCKNLKTIGGFPYIFCGFFIKPPWDATAKKETEGGQEEGLRKRNMGFVYTVIWCAQTPPPPHLSPYLARPASPACGQGTVEGPPPSHPHPISTVRGHSGGSLGQPLIWRLWV